MLAVVILLVGFYLGNKMPFWVPKAISYFRNRHLLNSLIPKAADPDKLCKGTHPWMNARTFTDEGPATVKVCRVCGLIEGSNKQATQDAIDRIEENNRLRDLEDRLYREFASLEDRDVRKYFSEEIKNGLSYQKIAHIHTAGMTFGQRYTIYKASKKEEIEKELTGSNA